jgi:ATP-binding cassette subfamily B protein
MPSDASSSLQQIWQLLEGQRLRYTGAIAALCGATLFGYLVPFVGKVTIDFALVPDAPPATGVNRLVLNLLGGAEFLSAHLWLGAAWMVVLTALAGIFSYLKGRHASLASDGIARRLKDRLYNHLNHLPARFHDRADTGDLVQRCTSDVETVRLFLAVQIVEIGNAVILCLTALPLMLLIDVRMTLVSFVLLPPIVAYSYVYMRRVKHVFRDVEESEGELTGVIQENLTGIRVVRAFARQAHEERKFAGPNASYRDRHIRLLRLMAWFWSPSDFICLAQNGLVLIVGARWIAQGQLTVGALFAFLAYLNMLLWPVRQLGRILTDLGKAQVALGRLREILGQNPEPDTVAKDFPGTAPTPPPPTLAGAIEVRDLAFTHSGDIAALNGISFSVPPGETLAILGPSGAGKSTLIHLLLRLYDYDAGSIRVDGFELASLPRKWVRSQISVVMQEPFLYSKTLRENIRLGRAGAPDDAIFEAARVASIHETIAGFPAGYDTLIGERGITLSGGQRQRVALARALLREPPILILDDALSAVDSETEALILEALRRRRGRHTTLVIAHRLSTLAQADRVIVLDHGRIIQSGSHAELSRQDGLYRRLWQIQTSLETDFRDELIAGTPHA